MCENIKDALEKVAAQDSRNFAKIGNAIGWQGLEDEAKHNTENPGRAITKAAAAAASWYAGGLLGAGGSGAAETPGLMSAAYETAVPGVGAQQAAMLAEQTAPFGLQGLGATMQAGAGAQGLNPVTAMLAKGAGGLLSGGGGNGPAQKFLQAQRGLQMMQPQQPAPMPAGRPMPQPQQQSPLPQPYAQGNALSGSLPPPGMSLEEWLRRKQLMMGGGNV